jgi:hypothetical protein
VWTRWAHGRPVNVTELDYAVDALAEAARDAPHFARTPSEIDRAGWNELLAPIAELLPVHSIEPLPDSPAIGPDRDGPSIEL